VKRSDRDEPMWVAIHIYMEAMLGISLYSYLYFKLIKSAISFLLSLMLSLQQNQRRGWNRFCLEVGWGEGRKVAQTMYTYVSKWKNVERPPASSEGVPGVICEKGTTTFIISCFLSSVIHCSGFT
jgi:hypothetical protein